MKLIPKTLVIFFAMALIACSKDDQNSGNSENNSSLLEQIKQRDEATLFAKAVELVELSKDWSAHGSYTVFIPTDSVFQEFLLDNQVSSVEELQEKMGTRLLQQLLASHVYKSPLKINQIANGYAETMAKNDKELNIHAYLWRSNNQVRINGQTLNFEETDYQSGSNIFHTINRILSPATLKVLIASNSSDFSVLNSGIQVSDNISVILNQQIPSYTLLAPVDQAFDNYLAQDGFSNIQAYVKARGLHSLENLLKSHIIRGNQTLSGTGNASFNTLLANNSVNIDLTNGVLEATNGYNYSASILINDIQAINGSLNKIDKVLGLP